MLTISCFGSEKSEAKESWRVLNESSKKLPVIAERILIDQVWSGHPVGFFLMTEEDRQYVAYYNAERQMVVGMRLFAENQFTLAEIKSKSERPVEYKKNVSSTILGWDSHNYITMAIDRDGYVHLAGNMHCNQLTYFRTTKPYDVTRFEQIDAMIGQDENACTYPKFMKAPNEELVFYYRIGSSGKGNEIYNIYDAQSQTWKRLLDKPLPDGRGKMNAYILGPSLGPDGLYHISWVWRDTGDFYGMGQQAAKQMLSRGKVNLLQPTKLILRNSL